jgi:hypothetical protein
MAVEPVPAWAGLVNGSRQETASAVGDAVFSGGGHCPAGGLLTSAKGSIAGPG